MRSPASVLFRTGTHRVRVVPLVVLGLAAVVATACGSSTPSASTTSPSASTASIVKPPNFTLQGCTYVLDSTIPAGEPQGIKPDFGSFSPDQAATAALEQIKAHGGTAMVDGATLPGGTTLYAGPSTENAVGTIPSGDSIHLAEPLLWTDHAGGEWLASFLSCGGNSLYWASVKEITQQNHAEGSQIAAQIAELKTASPYDKSGTASLLPVALNAQGHLVFTDPKVTFLVGRGELTGLPAD